VIPAGLLEGFPGAGQEHPDLRVHDARLAGGDAEQASVEHVRLVAAHQPLVAAREAARPGVLEDRLVAGPVTGGHRLADEAAPAQQLPEVPGRVDAPGHPESVPDDGVAAATCPVPGRRLSQVAHAILRIDLCTQESRIAPEATIVADVR